LNSAITILKKVPTPNNQISPRSFKKSQQSIITSGRDTTPLKLPTLLKKTPSSSKIYNTKYTHKYDIFLVIKPIPSAYIQDSS
jgi:hypothetical protein